MPYLLDCPLFIKSVLFHFVWVKHVLYIIRKYSGMDEATIEERLRLYGSKTRCFCPSVSKATRIKASLSSPSERNLARSAFLTVFHHTAIAKQGTLRSRASSMSERSELRRRREERMENGVKNLNGSEAIPEYYLSTLRFTLHVLLYISHA